MSYIIIKEIVLIGYIVVFKNLHSIERSNTNYQIIIKLFTYYDLILYSLQRLSYLFPTFQICSIIQAIAVFVF